MHRQDVMFAWAGSTMSIVFFILVNLLTSPDYIWFIYPSFLLLLWPVSLHFIKKGEYKIHSIISSILIIFSLVTINYLYSPSHLWFLYAIYPVIWWPIVMMFENNRKTMSMALIGCISTIIYYSVLNVTLSPHYTWAIYPSFAVLWWPLIKHYVKVKKFFQLSIWASLLTITFFILVNIETTPKTVWAVYPIFVILWWPLSMYYFMVKKDKAICYDH